MSLYAPFEAKNLKRSQDGTLRYKVNERITRRSTIEIFQFVPLSIYTIYTGVINIYGPCI